MNSGSSHTGLLDSRTKPSDLSVSKHPAPSQRRFITLPLSSLGFPFGSRLHHWAAGSPLTPGRIEFVILQLDRSPRIASHQSSRTRSYVRLQAGERLPGEDFHLSVLVRFQAHSPRREPWVLIVAECEPQSAERFAGNLSPLCGFALLPSQSTPSRAWLGSDGPPGRCNDLSHFF